MFNQNSSGSDPFSMMSSLIWLIIMLLFIAPALIMAVKLQSKKYRRKRMIEDMEEEYGVRIITMIHREESAGLLGFKMARYIDIEDSERVLEAIYMTPADMPIWVILHTPGGLVIAAHQIAMALSKHKAGVKVWVPHWAMSGGTFISLAATEIAMAPNAVLGPIDPQLSIGLFEQYPAASIVAALERENPHRDDKYLILGDLSGKAIRQVEDAAFELLRVRMDVGNAARIAKMLSEGRWTHDHPITVEKAKEIGLPVKVEMPLEMIKLMRLYDSPQQRPGIEYIPKPYTLRGGTNNDST